jgi:hypothetical protein
LDLTWGSTLELTKDAACFFTWGYCGGFFYAGFPTCRLCVGMSTVGCYSLETVRDHALNQHPDSCCRHGLCIFALWKCTFGPYLWIQCIDPRSERVIWCIAGLGFTWYHQIRAPGSASRDIYLGSHTGIDPRTHKRCCVFFLYGATA